VRRAAAVGEVAHVYTWAVVLALALAGSAASATGGLRRLQCFAPATAGCTRATAVGLPAGAVVSADGRTVYVRSGVGSLGSLGVFARAASGRLTQIQCVARHTSVCADGRGLETPSAIALSPDGQSAYVAAVNGRSVGIYRRLASGRLVATGLVTGVSRPRAVAVSPDGRNVYVGGDRLWTFARSSTGGLRLVGSGGFATNALVITPNGRFVYTAGGGGSHGFLFAWRRNPATGFLSQVGPALCGRTDGPGCTPGLGLLQPVALAFTPGSSRLWIVATVSAAVTQYRVAANGAIGALVARRGGLPLATGLALAGGRAYVSFRDGIASFDASLRPTGTTPLRGATGVAALGRSVYAASPRRVTVFAR
jgi:DNA-binding beta-propeller fold protein YncE